MAETRHRTVLEIGVDDREVRGLGTELARTFDPRVIQQFESALDRASRTLGRLVDQQTRLTQVLDRMASQQRQDAGRGGDGGGRGRGPGFMGRPGWMQDINTFAQRTGATYFGTMAAQSMQGGGILPMALSAMPVFGPIMAAGVHGVQQFYQDHVQRIMARAGAFGATGMGAGAFRVAEGLGARFGIGPAAASQMAAGFAGQTGLVGPELLAAMGGPAGKPHRGLIGLQQLMGFQNIGSVLGAAGAAGGQYTFDTATVLEDAVASGMSSGWRESRLDQFFQQFSGWLEGIRTAGMPLDTESAFQLVRAVGTFGGSFQGEAGLRAAQGFQQALAGAGQREGAGALIAMRAAGLRGGGFGTRGYMEAQAYLEQHPQEVMRNMLQMYQQISGGGQVSTPGFAAFLQSTWAQIGMQMSATQAMDMAQAAMQGGDLTQVFADTQEQGRGMTADMMRRRRRDGRGVIGEAAVETQYQLARADLGQTLAPAARAFRNLEFVLSKALLPAMGSLTEYIQEAARLIAAGDWAGLGAHVVSPLTNIGGALPEAVETESRRAAGQALREARQDPLVAAQYGVVGMALLERLAGEGEVRTTRRGLGSQSEVQGQVLEEARRRGYSQPERQRMLERMEQGASTPESIRDYIRQNAPSVDDGTSLIIDGAMLIIRGAEELHRRSLPGEGDLTEAPV